MDLKVFLKFSAVETYTDSSDIDQQYFKDLTKWHWEDKNLPFLKDEYPGEDTNKFKKDPEVYQELDDYPEQAYDGVQASLTKKLSWMEEKNPYDISPENILNLYPSKRKDNYDYKKRNTKEDEEMIFEKGLHQSVDRPEVERDLLPYF
jgi:hypothetical protein